MAKEEFQANWRGARKYQFDEETRLKQAAFDRRFPDPDPAPLPQPTEPIPNTEIVPLPEPRPRRGWFFIAMMVVLFATVASIAGYVTMWIIKRPQINTPELSLPSEVPLPSKRPHK